MKVCAMLEKQSVDEMLLKAKSYANNGDILEAQKLYQTVLEAKKKLIQQELATLNKHQKAIQTPPQETLNQLANLYKQGQFQAAVQEAQILSEQYPQAFVIWNLLGASATQIGMSDQALHAYKEAISIKPDYAEAYCNMGITFQNLGKFDEAIDFFDMALGIDSLCSEAFYGKGSALKKKGEDFSSCQIILSNIDRELII